ncbi:MAG: tetratricopeptide repeat protein [Terriglobales bacterium]
MTALSLHSTWLGWLLLAAMCSAQTPSRASTDRTVLVHVLQLARAHRYSEAAVAMRGVPLPVDPQQRIVFYRLRASIESGLGNSKAAATDMEAASKLAPVDVQLQVAAALARLELQLETHVDPALTLKTLRGAQLPADRQLEVRLHTGEVLSRAHLYSEAAEDFAEAARLAPDRADIFFNLALARYYGGQWDEALESAERAKTLEDNGPTESLLGDIQEKRGDALSAVHSYQAAVTLEPNVEQHRLTLATEFLRHQTFDAAIVVLEQSAGLFPQSVHTKMLMGLAYYLVDRSPDSIHALLEATKLDGKDGLAARYLGEITLQDSATPDPVAVKRVCAFADAHPVHKTANALCGGVLLRVAQDSGDTSRGPEILHRLREAVRIAPDEPVARCQLGKALEWSQQWREARTQMEKCVRLDPDSPEGHYRLARVYRRLGLSALAGEQTSLQKQAAKRESDESTRRANSVSRFLVLLDR